MKRRSSKLRFAQDRGLDDDRAMINHRIILSRIEYSYRSSPTHATLFDEYFDYYDDLSNETGSPKLIKLPVLAAHPKYQISFSASIFPELFSYFYYLSEESSIASNQVLQFDG